MGHTANQWQGWDSTQDNTLTHPLQHPHHLSHGTILTCHFIDQETEAQLVLPSCTSTPSYKVHFAPLYYMLNFMTFHKKNRWVGDRGA